jgi:hypothetical protein
LYEGANAPFSFRRRAKGRGATIYAFFVKLHNFNAKNCLNFVQYFFPKPIDFSPYVWYNISVRGREAERQTRPISKTHGVTADRFPLTDSWDSR